MNTNIYPKEEPILEWSAPQHAHPHRGKKWYIAASTFVIFCVGYSIWTQAWTFTILVVALAYFYWKLHLNAPADKTLRIWEQGFAIEDDFTQWGQCTGFWMLRNPEFSELYIEHASGKISKIQTSTLDPYMIYGTLAPLVQELPDRRERPLDTIIRICKL